MNSKTPDEKKLEITGKPDGETDFPVRVFRTADIKSISVGIPGTSHRHLRAAIETEEGIMVFQEASIAALVRAYITIKTHPTCRALCLKGKAMEDRKSGYASWQLVEDIGMSQEETEKFLEEIIV